MFRGRERVAAIARPSEYRVRSVRSGRCYLFPSAGPRPPRCAGTPPLRHTQATRGLKPESKSRPDRIIRASRSVTNTSCVGRARLAPPYQRWTRATEIGISRPRAAPHRSSSRQVVGAAAKEPPSIARRGSTFRRGNTSGRAAASPRARR